MCGITGILHEDGRPIRRDVLERMTGALTHRGPDDHGIRLLSTGREAQRVGFGHRRLSIIDLSANGRQPMTNEDGRVWLTYNGEVYNFQELKKDLTARGHRFRSRTDTEVIVHAYEEWGEEAFGRLNGMFAFGLWDGRRRALYLVRDRYGEKPLYYSRLPAGLAFASELKSLIQHPNIGRDIDPDSLSRYLLYEYVPAPHSIFKGVRKLPAAHYLKWQGGQIEVSNYWRVEFNGDGAGERVDFREAKDRLVELLRKAVSRRLVSDVPVGLFLSGGLDSGAILSVMSDLMPPGEIRTFSIGFRETSFDESGYARFLAERFGTDHHELILTPARMLDLLPEVHAFLDEPFADPSVIPTYLLAGFAGQTVKVALGGDGGDELLAGYDTFPAHVLARYYNRLPDAVGKRALPGLIRRLPVSSRNMSFDFKLKQFIKGTDYQGAVRNQAWLGSFTPEEQQRLFGNTIRRRLNGFNPFSDVQQAVAGRTFQDWLQEIIYHYSVFYLAEDILTKVDRAGMAVSLEVRAPFLDVELSEFLNRCPSRFKLRGFSRKYLLKKSFEDRLPPQILRRRKKGFGIPLARWIKHELKDEMRAVFDPVRIKTAGLFDPAAVKTLLQDHLSGARDNRKPIWTLYMFEKWRERYSVPGPGDT